MAFFSKYSGPVFLKQDSESAAQLSALQQLHAESSGDAKVRIEREIKIVEAGIYGEESVAYELTNSHIPMLVLHDLFLSCEGLTAQIDYLIITRGRIFVLECKNLIGNIEINNRGEFIRTIHDGKRSHTEGMYSPITQNRRHMELIRALRGTQHTNIITKALFEKHFDENYCSVIVLANPHTILNARYAKKEIREQIIRADGLVEYIRSHNEGFPARSEKDMDDLAEFFLAAHHPQQIDYMAKYRDQFCPAAMASDPASAPTVCCPVCGAVMIKRLASKGKNAGKSFYGCSNYPKCRGIVNIN